MFSKAWELAGAALIAIAIAYWVTWEAGMLLGGLFLLVTGSTLDDAALGARVRRSVGWIRYFYWRQIIRENGGEVPTLHMQYPAGWAACACHGDPDCPVCNGSGAIPDPTVHVNPLSPHPPLRVDPQAKVLADQQANARQERAKLHDRTPALSRPSPVDDLERLA